MQLFRFSNQIVDKSDMMNVTFEEMTLDGEDSSSLGSNFSPIGLCEIGTVSVKKALIPCFSLVLVA